MPQSLPHEWNIKMVHKCSFNWISLKFFLPRSLNSTSRTAKTQIFANSHLTLKITYRHSTKWEPNSVLSGAPEPGVGRTLDNPLGRSQAFPESHPSWFSCGAERSHSCQTLQNFLNKINTCCFKLPSVGMVPNTAIRVDNCDRSISDKDWKGKDFNPR